MFLLRRLGAVFFPLLEASSRNIPSTTIRVGAKVSLLRRPRGMSSRAAFRLAMAISIRSDPSRDPDIDPLQATRQMRILAIRTGERPRPSYPALFPPARARARLLNASCPRANLNTCVKSKITCVKSKRNVGNNKKKKKRGNRTGPSFRRSRTYSARYYYYNYYFPPPALTVPRFRPRNPVFPPVSLP